MINYHEIRAKKQKAMPLIQVITGALLIVILLTAFTLSVRLSCLGLVALNKLTITKERGQK